MSVNPYEPPAGVVDVEHSVTPSRTNLAALIRSFLAGDLTAFQFDDRLDAFRDADDSVIQFVTSAVWFHYDDCTDHSVCLSKPEWDFFQRLLLLLASDCEMETSSRRVWSVRQGVAAAALSGFLYLAACAGWGQQLLILAMPFGAVSILLARFAGGKDSPTNPYEGIIEPFATLSDLERAYHSAGFRKTRYPKRLDDGPGIRSPFMDAALKIHFHIVWLMFSPIPLLIQCLPTSYVETRARAMPQVSS